MAEHEVLEVSNDPALHETGGGHNQKGVDFQRYWAITRMLELQANDQLDYLLLFEAVQDITELNTADGPTAVKVYQVKKKDRNDWTWADLTGLPVPGGSRKPVAQKFSASAFGKLCRSIAPFKLLTPEAHFVSNAGCNLPLANGGNAASSLPLNLGGLDANHIKALQAGLGLIIEAGRSLPDVGNLYVNRVMIDPDAPDIAVVGLAFDFLASRSPRHASQARALVEALLAKISPLGRRTLVCATFDQLRRERGFAKRDFTSALLALQEVPDLLALLEEWLHQLQSEGVDLMSLMGIRMAAAEVFRQMLVREQSFEEEKLSRAIDQYVADHPPTSVLKPFLEGCYLSLVSDYSSIPEQELQARILLRGIQRCAVQT